MTRATDDRERVTVQVTTMHELGAGVILETPGITVDLADVVWVERVVRMPTRLRDAVKARATADGMSMAEAIRLALRAYVDHGEGE